MHASAINKWHSDAGKSVILRVAVVTADKTGSARSITFSPRLGEYLVNLLLIACQSVLRLVRFAQPLQNFFPLPVWAERQIGASHSGHQPIHRLPNADHITRVTDVRTLRPAGFPPFHVVTGGHGRRARHLLAETIKNWRGGFGDAVVAVTLARGASKAADAVMALPSAGVRYWE